MDWALLGGLSDADTRVVLASAHRRRFARGEVVFHEADPADTVHLVVEGRFAARRSTPAGDTVTFSIVGPGDTFGEMAIIDDAPRSLTAVAAEESVIASIDSKTFLFLVHETPTFAIQVMRSLASRIRQLDDQL